MSTNPNSASSPKRSAAARVNGSKFRGHTTAQDRNGTSYYRIQGPKLVIEYAPQPLGGDPSMHIHTIYRDPTNDYGRKPAVK